MLYAKIDANENVIEYPVHDKWIRSRLPHIAFPTVQTLPADIIAEHGYVPVTPVAKPTAKTKYYTQGTPTKLADGTWKQVWVSQDKTTAMKAVEKNDLKTVLKGIRKATEDGGFTFNGMIIDSAPESQNKLHAVRTIAAEHLADPVNKPWADINWQGRDGDWYTLTAQDVIDLAGGLFMFVEVCYTAQKQTELAIAAETVTTAAEVKAEFESNMAAILASLAGA